MIGSALKAGLLLLVMRHVAAVVVRIAHQFRLSLIDALISARWSYFVEPPAGRLATAIGGESERAAEVFLHAARLLADSLLVTVFLGFALVVIHWRVLAVRLVGQHRASAMNLVLNWQHLVQ